MATIRDVQRGDSVCWKDGSGTVHQLHAETVRLGDQELKGSTQDPVLVIHTEHGDILKKLSDVALEGELETYRQTAET